MAKIRKILVPVDGSDSSTHAVKYAVDLAKPLNASVFFYHVLHLPALAGITLTKSMKESSQEKIDAILGSAISIANKANVSCKQQVQGGGNSGKKIIEFAKKFNFDLIVMGPRGMSSASEAFLGSVSHHVIHKSPIPVTIVR